MRTRFSFQCFSPSAFQSAFSRLLLALPVAVLALCLAALPASAQTGLGTALSFDGVDDYVVITNFGDWAPTNEVTVEFWQRAAAAKMQVTFALYPDQETNRILAVVPSPGNWVIWDFGDFPAAGRLGYETNAVVGSWQHFALVASQSGNFMRIYRNGALEAEKEGMTPFVRGAYDLRLGGSDAVEGAGAAFFGGELDEVRIWEVARSQEDITNHMLHPLTGMEPGLVAYYRFDEAAGGMARDSTTNHLDGTLVNDPQRVASCWRPAITLNGPEPFTNECHTAFDDPGANVSASPLAIAAGGYHSLALKADGSVVGWGNNYYGQTNVPPSAASGVVAIAAGGWHSLALKADGSVVGWELNDDGQTDIPSSASSGVVAIAAGDSHSLALKADGSVVGWGLNDDGQTDIPSSASSGVVAIAAGDSHSLALKADGSVVGWGYNFHAQTDIPASAASGVVAIAAGLAHSLALKADGSVVSWGGDYYGQTDIPPSATNGVVAIAAGLDHSLALKADGSVVGWGNNSFGQTNVPPSAASGVVAIAAGFYHSLALQGDGSIVGWGGNGSGQTNIPSGLNTLNLPIAVSGTVDTNAPGTYLLTYSVTNATATRTVVVADTLPPTLTLLGDNPILHALGEPFTDPGATAEDLCSGDWTWAIVPYINVNPNVPGIYTNTFAVADPYGNVAETNRAVIVVPEPLALTLPATNLLNGAATLQGSVNPNGLGTTAWFEWGTGPSYTNTTPPTAVGSGSVPVPVQANLTGLTPGVIYHYRVVASNRVAVARGAEQVFWTPALALNGPDRLTNECHTAFRDPGATVSASPLAIAAGVLHSLALKADGSIVGWGSNSDGQTTIPASATNGVVAIAAGSAYSLALKADGSIVGWGSNSDGQTNIPPSATSGVAGIAAGAHHSLALKGDSSVVGWGKNDFHQTDVPPSATNGVVAIAAGYWHSLALKADSSVVGWGGNHHSRECDQWDDLDCGGLLPQSGAEGGRLGRRLGRQLRRPD